MLREHPMWEYTGMKDTTRTKNNELSPDEFDARIRAITNIDREGTPTLAHTPLSSDNPPKKVKYLCLDYFFLLIECPYELLSSDSCTSFIDRIGRSSPTILLARILA